MCQPVGWRVWSRVAQHSTPQLEPYTAHRALLVPLLHMAPRHIQAQRPHVQTLPLVHPAAQAATQVQRPRPRPRPIQALRPKAQPASQAPACM